MTNDKCGEKTDTTYQITTRQHKETCFGNMEREEEWTNTYLREANPIREGSGVERLLLENNGEQLEVLEPWPERRAGRG